MTNLRRLPLFLIALLALAANGRAKEDGTAQATGSKGITVAVITHAGGAHLGAYFNALAETEEATAVVLADPDGTAEKEGRAALGDKLTAVYTDWTALYAKEKPTMALISMEARLAPEAIAAALKAGCHVLAEKPACVRVEDFEPLVTQAESTGRYLMLALANRLNPEIQKAKALIAEGALGDLYNVQMNLIQDQTRLASTGYQSSWLADKSRAGGGHLSWLGIHWLDLAMYLTDAPITHVAGFAGNVGGEPIGIEDSVALSVQFGNGTFGTMSSGYYLNTGSQSLLKIWGSKGWLQIDSDARRRVRWHSTASGAPLTEVYNGEESHVAYTAWVRACVRASAGLAAPPITAVESLRVLKVVFGTYDAAAKGITIKVN